MCDLPDTGLPIIDDAFDIIEDVFEGIVDIIEDVVSWLIPIPDMPDFDDGFNDPTARTDGVLVNKKSSSGGIPLIYGMRRVGGTLVFVQTSNDNEFLYMVMVLGEGKLNACKKIFLDDIRGENANDDGTRRVTPPILTDKNTHKMSASVDGEAPVSFIVKGSGGNVATYDAAFDNILNPLNLEKGKKGKITGQLF